LLAHGRWFSPGIPASSTTKTDRHDIAEILLKVALNTKNKINQHKIRDVVVLAINRLHIHDFILTLYIFMPILYEFLPFRWTKWYPV
jgi:hypothetical protein